MPEKIYVTYNYLPNDRARVQQMFLEAGMLDVVVDPALLTGFQKLGIPNEDVRARSRRPTARAPAPTVHRVLEPTARELSAARLLHVRLDPSQPRGHPRPGVITRIRRVPACGDGPPANVALVIASKEVRRPVYLGRSMTMCSCTTRSPRGCATASQGLALATSSTQGHRLPWRQLLIDHAMPPMIAAARGLVRGRAAAEAPCSTCACDGWFDAAAEPFIPAYVGEGVVRVPDFARTSERFGTGHWAVPVHGRRSLASRRIIVRPAVYAFFRARKLRGVRFTPVTVI